MSAPTIQSQRLEALSDEDLDQLCQAAIDAVTAGGGFGWVKAPPRLTMEAYWRGLMLVPGRHLFVVRLDGVIAGAMELHEQPANVEARAQVGKVRHGFLAHWARSQGLGQALLAELEAGARQAGLLALELDVRVTQNVAIRFFERNGYQLWGTHPHYAYIDGGWVAGRHYHKLLDAPAAGAGQP